MTDKEIIKALECCDYPTDDLCCECCFKDEYHCTTVLNEATIDLIKRQQAEIEMSANYKLLYEDLKDENLETIKCIKQAIEEAKTEAIKEFAERLKESEIDIDVSFGYGRECYTKAVTTIEIDNLVKEMVGE